MKIHYPKLYNMAHLLALNVLLLPKDLTIIFILSTFVEINVGRESIFRTFRNNFANSRIRNYF